ncbi:MAG: Crp/Fnr family transcriptional regulator [Rhodovibrionaceae bacterium]
MIDSSRNSVNSPLMRKLAQCIELDSAARMRLQEFEAAVKPLPPGADLIKENSPYEQAGVVVEGWCLKYKLLDDGRRQVINFVLPGGFIGLHANVFEIADHSVSTLTACQVSRFDPQQITKTFSELPRLAAAIVWDHAREEAVLMERLASLGRRSAYERFAHLLVELTVLLSRRSEELPRKVVLPITQAVIADTLGLSPVHVSRTIQRLRRDGLIEDGRQRGIALCDLAGLMRVCGFDETYLHQDALPKQTQRRIGA